MTRKILLTLVLSYGIQAQNITLSTKQEANWQIQVQKPKLTHTLPLGEFIAQVVTPPTLLHTISLPFDANVKKLNVAKYQNVTKGQILAEVSGTEWIATQQQAIADAIKFKHHEQLAQRKNILCKEEIIPQKECTAANAELEADKTKVLASKALLKSYGASDEMIYRLLKDLTLSQTIHLSSTVEGRIVSLHATPGKSTSPSDALFIIQAKGGLWLESDIEANRAETLTEGQTVEITLGNHTFSTTILQLSPVINPHNQTRQVRFEIPANINVFSGLRSTAKISLSQESYRIRKNAVIKEGAKQIVFVKTKEGYNSVAVQLLTEDNKYYYVKKIDALTGDIAVSSLAVLKNMLGAEDE